MCHFVPNFTVEKVITKIRRVKLRQRVVIIVCIFLSYVVVVVQFTCQNNQENIQCSSVFLPTWAINSANTLNRQHLYILHEPETCLSTEVLIKHVNVPECQIYSIWLEFYPSKPRWAPFQHLQVTYRYVPFRISSKDVAK